MPLTLRTRCLLLWLATALLAAGEVAPEPAPLRLAFLGDSITGAQPGVRYQGQYLKFADLIGLMAEARLGRPVTVLNCGLAGDKSYGMPGQPNPGAVNRVAEQVVAARADLAVVLIGGYDEPGETEKTRQALTSILTQLQTARIRTLVLTYHQPYADEQQTYRGFQRITGNNALITEVAKAQDCPVLDMEPSIAAAVARDGRGDLLDGHDGVHLKPAGEVVYARAIFAKLRELGWLPAAEPPTAP